MRRLDPQLNGGLLLSSKGNIYGDLLPPVGWFGKRRSARWIAKQLKRQGCRIRKASWDDEWEIESDFLEITCLKDGGDAWVSGVIADFDGSLDRLCYWLDKAGIEYKLELYDEGGELLHEIRGPT